MSPESSVRRILAAIENGQSHAAQELLPIIYDQLRSLAAQRLKEEAPSHTLQPTALVHEAYVRIVSKQAGEELRWDSLGHLYAALAEAMRRILIEKARAKKAIKRGRDFSRMSLDHLCPTVDDPPAELLDFDQAIEELTALDERQGKGAKLRLYAGLTLEEVASACAVSLATAERDWKHAKAWLLRFLREQDSP